MLIPILSIVISLISCIISALTIYRRRTDANPSQSEPCPPFSVSQYFERAEKAYLDTLEEQEPFEYEIVLWLMIYIMYICKIDWNYKHKI